jgi:hypothetical protein
VEFIDVGGMMTLVDELTELDPQLVTAIPSGLVSWVDCERDWSHGPAVAWLLPQHGTRVDRVCGVCAKEAVGRYLGNNWKVDVIVLEGR